MKRVTLSCHTCVSLSKVSNRFKEQETTTFPDCVGSHFNADIVKRERQLILMMRENITSMTHAMMITDERTETLKEGLLLLILQFSSSPGVQKIVRVDAAPGFRSLIDDKMLRNNDITVKLGEEKNENKNAVIDHRVSELHYELKREQPSGGPVSSLTLSKAMSRMNSRIRFNGLSAVEMWLGRDQFSGEQLPINDYLTISSRLEQRKANHRSSEKWKSRGKSNEMFPLINVGDIVYNLK